MKKVLAKGKNAMAKQDYAKTHNTYLSYRRKITNLIATR